MPAHAVNARPVVLPRRAMLLLPWLAAGVLAGCADTTPPPDFKPLSFGYLTKLRLTVATIDVDNEFTPKTVPGVQHVEGLSPIDPVAALRRMAQERLVPAGTEGHAVFVIDDASLVQTEGRFEGNLKVHLDISSDNGTKSGYAEARVSRTRTIVDDSVDATHVALYELTRQMMDDMNVEFEFQVRRTLAAYLESGASVAPLPAPVQQQDLSEPPAQPQP